ncbi:propionyl-CoA synthetase [Alishewanella longhuensis]|uniref:Propionyl-CoA synthetase n=1 Tax=Alishewanella longhuensis TaxID=1091037 RepID=A0ABQ3KXP5_9ALTE|nr:propionyl-CoA synthetase [Alishewanella longhuensis]GHG67872.1 propionyl-CoA synthetase [Alishewanella longhuensis]
MSYLQEYQASVTDPAAFWAAKAEKLAWFKKPSQILNEQNGQYQWFVDGELNTSYLALDYHIEQGRGEQCALIYDSPVTGTKQRYSYLALRDAVARFAGVLKANGVTKGDRVVIYMPMIPEAAIAMLATARLGAVHSVVFGGFAPHELAVRIDDATPKVVISASCGIEINRVIAYKPLLDSALEKASHQPERCIILQRPQYTATLLAERDLDWQQAMVTAEPAAPVAVNSTDPLYILYTSGTTGKPKGVVRDNGGHAVALSYSMKAIYNMDLGDVFWAASDVGWVVGHSYIVYGPLLAGCTTILYEGKPVFTPDAGAFWRVCAEYGVKAIFAAPTAFRAIRKEDPEAVLMQQYDLRKLESIFMAGERLDPPTYHWACQVSGKPVIDHWWQTETGWSICANLAGIELLPAKAGSATCAVPGYNLQILDDEGKPVAANQQGNIAIKLPLPPGCLTTVWGNPERFTSGYLNQFPGYYATGDGGYLDEEGYLFVMGRTDDVINVAGHRLSTGEMEEIIASHPAVAECCVIGLPDALKGQQPVGFVLLKNGIVANTQDIEAELVALVRQEIGAVASFKRALVVPRLPKTRSGKILRKLLRQIGEGQDYQIPSTIDDPASLPELAQLMKQHGLT